MVQWDTDMAGTGLDINIFTKNNNEHLTKRCSFLFNHNATVYICNNYLSDKKNVRNKHRRYKKRI